MAGKGGCYVPVEVKSRLMTALALPKSDVARSSASGRGIASQAIVALGALVVGRWIKVIYNAGIGPKYWSQEQRTGWRLD
jgi:hypothetical protein